MTRGKADYCSVNVLLMIVTIGHKTFTCVPHSDQQVSKIYYLSPRKVHLFGIQYANKLLTFSMKTKLSARALTAH